MNPRLKSLIGKTRDELQAEAMDRMEALATVARKGTHRVDSYAHKNPWFLAGLSSFFAAAFGFFLGRKSKKRR